MSNNALNAARVDVWLLKEIEWQQHQDEPVKKVRIIMQTLNGPCSFIALCNILILRGDIEILPPDRKEVAYEFLSSLVGDYILKASPDADVASALSILPMTQNGLDLNPLFTGVASFRPSGDGAALKLFEQTHIKLLHGWLCDPDSVEFTSMVGTEDYDSSMDLIVEADSLTKGQLVHGWESDRPATVADVSALTQDEQKKVTDAIAVQRFLDTTQSQLTYYGLFTLSSTVEPGQLVALFRNSHLAVLYKPHGQNSGLYTLVTDHTFTHEEAVVWEKLDDIEGSSQFVDCNFKESTPVGGDYAGETAETVARAYDDHAQTEAEAQDQALARQLQAEEDAHAQHLYEQQQRQRQAQEEPGTQSGSPNQVPIQPRRVVTDIHGLQDGNPPPRGKASVKKKGDCIIM